MGSLLKAGSIHNDKKMVTYPVAITWRKPKDGWSKLNTDGALKGCGLAAEGGVIRNKLGNIKWNYYDFYGTCSILEAELKAVAIGLQLCWQKDARKVWVEVDSSASMLLCTHQKKDLWDVLESIYQNLNKMEVQFSHIWRKGNKLADWFVNKGCTEKCFKRVQEIDFTRCCQRPHSYGQVGYCINQDDGENNTTYNVGSNKFLAYVVFECSGLLMF
ncbi:RNase H domain-containing protein [Abeliophyllum distichum]|uniref:RNase H domain-containing protein n=1 Tax=Abeliophyllum distichum TaxID=126358 RepID=A0ABD1Q4T9_9LAMI